MAIRDREEKVTRLDQRRMTHSKEANSHRAKRQSRREKMVRQHCKSLGIEFCKDMLTTKAFLEVLEYKRRAKLQSRGQRQAKDLSTERKWYGALAHEVTDYIQTEWKGFMWGESLSDLYDEIAEALNRRSSDDDIDAKDIEYAVDTAVGKKLLRRKDLNDTSSHEWVCVDLVAA